MIQPGDPPGAPDSDALRRYAELVRTWAPQMDLVSDSDLVRFEDRHIRDSLRAQPFLDELPEGPICDVGSGAGLPGIPLALVTGRFVRLIEPRVRRASFLEECVRSLEMNAEVLTMTAEQAARDPRYSGAHVAAFARALAAPAVAAEMILPLVADGGAGVVWVGRDAPRPRDAEFLSQGIVIVRRK